MADGAGSLPATEDAGRARRARCGASGFRHPGGGVLKGQDRWLAERLLAIILRRRLGASRLWATHDAAQNRAEQSPRAERVMNSPRARGAPRGQPLEALEVLLEVKCRPSILEPSIAR